MFGFVLANRSLLTQEQLARYRSCYCGLCGEIGHTYGSLQRFALNYDMTFLVLLLSSLYEPEEAASSVRCVAHPWKPHAQWRNAFTAYAAAMNVALAYYQCMDDWEDEKKLLSRLEASIFSSSLPAIEAAYPRQVNAIQSCLAELHRIEQQDVQEPDTGANLFGSLMQEIFAAREDRWTPLLRQMGMALGRFIYLLDAVLDLPGDLKAGRYNPFRTRASDGFSKSTCLPVLQILMGECTNAFERLPLVQDVDILRNILYSGVWLRYYQDTRENGKEAYHV